MASMLRAGAVSGVSTCPKPVSLQDVTARGTKRILPPGVTEFAESLRGGWKAKLLITLASLPVAWLATVCFNFGLSWHLLAAAITSGIVAFPLLTSGRLRYFGSWCLAGVAAIPLATGAYALLFLAVFIVATSIWPHLSYMGHAATYLAVYGGMVVCAVPVIAWTLHKRQVPVVKLPMPMPETGRPLRILWCIPVALLAGGIAGAGLAGVLIALIWSVAATVSLGGIPVALPFVRIYTPWANQYGSGLKSEGGGAGVILLAWGLMCLYWAVSGTILVIGGVLWVGPLVWAKFVFGAHLIGGPEDWFKIGVGGFASIGVLEVGLPYYCVWWTERSKGRAKKDRRIEPSGDGLEPRSRASLVRFYSEHLDLDARPISSAVADMDRRLGEAMAGTPPNQRKFWCLGALAELRTATTFLQECAMAHWSSLVAANTGWEEMRATAAAEGEEGDARRAGNALEEIQSQQSLFNDPVAAEWRSIFADLQTIGTRSLTDGLTLVSSAQNVQLIRTHLEAPDAMPPAVDWRSAPSYAALCLVSASVMVRAGLDALRTADQVEYPGRRQGMDGSGQYIEAQSQLWSRISAAIDQAVPSGNPSDWSSSWLASRHSNAHEQERRATVTFCFLAVGVTCLLLQSYLRGGGTTHRGRWIVGVVFVLVGIALVGTAVVRMVSDRRAVRLRRRVEPSPGPPSPNSPIGTGRGNW